MPRSKRITFQDEFGFPFGRSCLVFLTGREYDVMCLYYKEGKTFRQISEMFGCSAERIRQIKAIAHKKIKNRIKDLTRYRFQIILNLIILKRLTSSSNALVAELIEKVLADKTDVPIKSLHLSNQAYAALYRAGIDTLQKIIDVEFGRDILSVQNIGSKAKKEILQSIGNYI